MQPVKLINGRTPEQWAAYDRAKLIGAVSLGLLLVFCPLAGRGPTPVGGCCGPPAAAVVPRPWVRRCTRERCALRHG